MLNTSNHQGNANQTHKKISFHSLVEWLSLKRQGVTSVGEDVEKKKPLYTIGRKINWCSHYRKQYEQYEGSSKNLKHNHHMIQQFQFWVFIRRKQSENIKSKRYIYPHVHYSIIYNRQDKITI